MGVKRSSRGFIDDLRQAGHLCRLSGTRCAGPVPSPALSWRPLCYSSAAGAQPSQRNIATQLERDGLLAPNAGRCQRSRLVP